MTKVCKPRTRHDPYSSEATRVVSIRVDPETLKSLRHIAADKNLTVCSMLRIAAEQIAGDAP
jgi:antitoxin component of RelBE/YafQ-DinJ toxin-antitoxin module